MMKTLNKYAVLAMLLTLALWGCQRIPLYERTTNVYLDFKVNIDLDYKLDLSVDTDIPEEYESKIYGKMPEYVEVLFYDRDDHTLKKSQILPVEGGFLDVPAGEYDLVIYSFGTESTQVVNTHYMYDAQAFTTDITKEMASKLFAVKAITDDAETKGEVRGYDDDPIIHEPDHLYVVKKEGVSISSFLDKTGTVTIDATAHSIVEVYSMEVLGVKGAENIERVDAFITGQVKSHYFGADGKSQDPATLYITMTPDAENNRLYTVFGTFGKLTGEENKVYLDIMVTNSGGGQYRYIYDVTEQFDDTANENNKLVIGGDEIDIPKAEFGGSGLAPSVDGWDNETVEVPLG